MRIEWPEHSLEDLSKLIVDCPHSTPKWTDDGVIVLRNQYIRGGRLDLNNPSFTTEEGYKSRIKRAVPTPGDLVLTREAPMGEVCQIPDGVKCCLGQRMVLIRPDEDHIDAKYLLFALQSPYLQHQIGWNEGTGTTVSNIRLPILRAFQIPTPPLSEQRAIAHILGTLDDKIELNRRMNATLEGMAQALFKSWFVDFDPVVDKALAAGHPIPEPLHKRAEARRALGEKRKPLPAAIEQHFPSRFVFSEEMGWVPEGWESLTFENLVAAKQGRYLAKDEMISQPDEEYKYPVWGGNGILGYSLKKAYDEPVTLMTCRGSNCGLIKSTKSAAWVSNNSFACLSKFGSEYFLYLYFLYENFSECVSGSAQPQITYTALKNKLMKFPVSRDVCDCFSESVQVYRDNQFANENQNYTLTQLRDTLLPKLLSGQLRIPDAEKLIEEAL